MRNRLEAQEQQQKKSGASKEVVDGYQARLEELAKRSADQAAEVSPCLLFNLLLWGGVLTYPRSDVWRKRPMPCVPVWRLPS